MKQYNYIDDCCGCGSCVDVCPKSALSLVKNEKGFYKAFVDNSICVDCHLCKKVCPEINCLGLNQSNNTAFLFKTHNNTLYQNCSSGGVCAELYNYFIDLNAVVFGVKYNNLMVPVCEAAYDHNSTECFSGSKYIQADFTSTSRKIANELINGKTVLVVSTPCSIQGIYNFLRISNVDTSNLYTVDFMCHGVGSPKVWNDYIQFLSNHNDQVVDFKFRTKTNNVDSHTHHSRVIYKSGNVLFDKLKCKVYQNLYFKNLIMNDSCYSCKFARADRVADLTVADNSGYKQQPNDVANFRNSSLVLVNSDKGQKLLELLNTKGYSKMIGIDDVIQPHLKTSNKKNENYDNFWNIYLKKGFKSVARSFGGYNLVSYIKMKINKII